MKSKPGSLARQTSALAAKPDALLAELRELIHNAREQLARTVDSGLVVVYWQVGHRVRAEILKDQRAEYGARIVSAVGRQLGREFGRGFSEKSLRHMIRFAEAFPDPEIVSALSRQLGWSHFLEIVYLDEPLKKELERKLHEAVRLARARLESLKSEATGHLPAPAIPQPKPPKKRKRK